MKYLFSIFFFHFCFLFYGQITFTKIPIDLQLVARDQTTNYGNVSIEGTVDFFIGYESLRVEVFRNNIPFDQFNKPLVYLNEKATFEFNIKILSELANYSFKIYGYSSTESTYILEKTISNIVAGDTYIIQGQSNAVASKRIGSANANRSEFIRVFANGTNIGTSLLSNEFWYVANGDVFCTSNGNTGQWGLKLAKLLIDKIGVPIAIFNGAYPGREISYFKAPKDYRTSQTSNYGRLFYRLDKSGLKNNVKAILWSQGETDGVLGTTINSYANTFNLLMKSWLIDYPNIEKIYIFQTKDCSSVITDSEMNIKESQRLLSVTNSQIQIISTTSLNLLPDSCHFPFSNGYEEFANRLYKLILTDLYGWSFTEEIKSPMIKSAEFFEPNILVVETDARQLKFSSDDQSTILSRIKQDFVLKNAQNAVIANVNLVENKIIFTLSADPGPIANISFVGNNSNIGFTITNSADLEFICFRNFPIKNYSYDGGNNSYYPIIENTSICATSGSIVNIPVFNPKLDASYKWLFKIPNGDWTEITSLNASTTYLNYTSTQLEIKRTATFPISGTLYRVVASYGVLGDFTSNEIVLTINAAPISKTISGINSSCAEVDITLTYDSGSLGNILWQYSTTSNQEDFIDDDIVNGLNYTVNNIDKTMWFRVMNTNGVCSPSFSPVFQVAVNPKPVAGIIIGGNITVCRNANSTSLSLENYIGSIHWQKASSLTGTFSNITSAISETYIATGLTATTYFRAVLSSGVCPQVITEPVVIYVDPLPVSKTISGASTICFGDNETLTYGTGSIGIIQWQFSTTSSLDGFIDLEGENNLIFTAVNLHRTTWFRVKNTSGQCLSTISQAVEVIINPKPIAGFISGGDISVCRTTNSTTLKLNDFIGNIQWQRATSLTGTYSNISSAVLETFTATGLTTTTYFRAVLTTGACSQVITEVVVIFVDPLPVSKIIYGASPICFGDNETLTYGSGSVGVIQWQFSTTSSLDDFVDLVGENDLVFTANNLQKTTWYRVKNTSGQCSSTFSQTVQVIVNPKPIAGFISGGDVSVCKTTNSTTLNLNDFSGSIQWQRATAISGTYTNITSASMNQYIASGLTATTYFRAILSSNSCLSVNADPVAVFISSEAVAKTISSAATICQGESNTLNYDTGSIGSIQWQSSTTSSTSNFTNITDEKSNSYIANNLQRTTWYRVMNSIGLCSTVYSPAIQIIVNQKPLSGFISGGGLSFCIASTANTMILNNYSGGIQWQRASTPTGSYSNIVSATTASYTATGLTSTTYFRAVLSSGVCTPQITESVFINVDPTAVTRTISGASSTCSGDSKMLNYGTGSVGTIQWQSSTTSSSSNFADIIGANTLDYTANNLQRTSWYRVKNTSGVCPVLFSSAVQVDVIQKPLAGFISGGDKNVCVSSNSTTLLLNNSLGNIQWQRSSSLNGSYSNIALATSASYTASGLTSTAYFRAVLSSGVCTPQITEAVFINVDPIAVTGTISGASTTCSGDNKTLNYGTGSVGTIQWQLSTTSSSSNFADIIGANVLDYTATNLQSTTWYRVKNTSGVCPVLFSTVAQVEVSPKPTAGSISGGDINVCVSLNSTTLLLNNYSGSIQWQRASSPTGSYSNIASATSASYTATGLTSTTYFRAVLSSGVCTPQTTEAVFINIDPIAVTRTISGASTTCSGDNKTLNYGTGSVGAIQWQSSTTSSSSNFADILGANTIDYTANNLQSTTWYRVKNTSGVCPVLFSAPVQLSVNTKTIPIFNEIAPICRGTTILPILPLISINNINGTWSPPVVNNLESKTYTFTPSSNTCASTITMDITVNSTPSPIGESTQIFNFSSPALVSDLIVSGSNIKWFSSSNNAFSNSNALALSTELIAGNSYYAMQFINGCFSNSPLGVTVSNSLSLNEFKTNEFTLFPNPFNDSFIVKYSKVIKNVELFNNLGQSVFKSRYDSKEVNIIVNFLPSGIYYVKILTEDHNTQIKALKL